MLAPQESATAIMLKATKEHFAPQFSREIDLK